MTRPYTGAELDAMMVEIEAQAEPPPRRRPYKRRIGPSMEGVVRHVSLHPGLPMKAAAESIRRVPGSTNWQPLYEAVHNCLRASLVFGVPGPRGSTLLYSSETEAARHQGFHLVPNNSDIGAPSLVPENLIVG